MSTLLVAAALLTASTVDDVPAALGAAPLASYVECDAGWACRIVPGTRETIFRRGWHIRCDADGHFTYCRTEPGR